MTNPARADSFGSRNAALAGGAKDALGAPAVVLAASYIGFGSLCRGAGFTWDLAVLSTASMWALPGQVLLVELNAVGASLLSIGLAVAFTNARLMPMVVALLPHLRAPGVPRWRYYAAAHLIAITSWIAGMQRCPGLPVEERLPYLVGFGGLLWTTSMLGTALGFALAGAVPPAISLGLTFLNPIYFLLLLLPDWRTPLRRNALVLGAVLGPLCHLVSPDWGLMTAGVVGGSLAFAWARRKGAPR
jgi:predicted branched-subunit amino acid permease